jgi:hypothetical protein
MAPRNLVFVGPLGGGVRVTRRRRLSMMTVSALARIVVEFISEHAGSTVNGEYQAFIECAAAMMPPTLARSSGTTTTPHSCRISQGSRGGLRLDDQLARVRLARALTMTPRGLPGRVSPRAFTASLASVPVDAFVARLRSVLRKPTSRLRLRVAFAFRLLDVRHSYAAAALQAGVPPKVISERLGHAGVAFTLQA